jgi:uncharacterized protein YhbP (UPF0306 family)
VGDVVIAHVYISQVWRLTSCGYIFDEKRYALYVATRSVTTITRSKSWQELRTTLRGVP